MTRKKPKTKPSAPISSQPAVGRPDRGNKDYLANQRVVSEMPDSKKYVNVTLYTTANNLSRLTIYQWYYANKFSHTLRFGQGIWVPKVEADEMVNKLQGRVRRASSAIKFQGALKSDETAVGLRIKTKYLNAVEALAKLSGSNTDSCTYLSDLLDEVLEKDNSIKQVLSFGAKKMTK